MVDSDIERPPSEQSERAFLQSGTCCGGCTAGLRAIKAAGGLTFAQSEESAKFNAMRGARFERLRRSCPAAP